jgi:hypothetical protein
MKDPMKSTQFHHRMTAVGGCVGHPDFTPAIQGVYSLKN